MNREAGCRDMLRHFPKLLARWKGGVAAMRQLTSSHQTLTICIERKEVAGNLQIFCLGPIYIRGPVTWSGCKIEVVLRDDLIFVVQDTNVGVEIHTESVEVKEYQSKETSPND